MKIHIWTDGSCSGNPGPGGMGVRIEVTPAGKPTKVLGLARYSPLATNNAMEMGAVVLALQAIQSAPVDSEIVLHSDSQLVIRTMTEGWKRKKNLAIWELIDKLSSRFSNITWVWIPREQNTWADAQARSAVEKGVQGRIEPRKTYRRVF